MKVLLLSLSWSILDFIGPHATTLSYTVYSKQVSACGIGEVVTSMSAPLGSWVINKRWQACRIISLGTGSVVFSRNLVLKLAL